MRRKLTIGVIAIALLGACALAQGPTRPTGTVHGTVFIAGDDGSRLVIPSLPVSLTGPTHTEVQSDELGNFSFDSVIPGNYTISAEAPGMAATQNIEVAAGSSSEISLRMKLVVVAQSTTVPPAQIRPTQESLRPPILLTNQRSKTCQTSMSTSKACCLWFPALFVARMA